MIKFLTSVALIGVAIANSATKISTRSSFPDGRIIGGESTTIEKVPYQISIAIKGQHYCGGSIIAKDWVLTAGHCANFPAKSYIIRAGSSQSHAGGSLHRVSRVITHEKYYENNAGVPTNDIALFRVATSFTMDQTRQAVDMYRTGEATKVGIYSVITGWGTISKNGSVSPKLLQTVSVPIISKEACQKAYGNLSPVNAGQICAAYPQGGKDACQGDSGGPLVVEGRLAGVVSWGNGCGIAGNPGVYTEVAYYRTWIDSTMKS